MHTPAIPIHLHRSTAAIYRPADMLLILVPLEIVQRRRVYPLPADPQIHPLPLWQLNGDITAGIGEVYIFPGR